MGLGLRIADLRANAEAKLIDAVILLEHKRYSNAYYLAGYAVELGLKACIAKQFVADVIPEKDFVNKIYSHKFQTLVGLAGLTAELEERQNQDVTFAENWALAAQWSEECRYGSTDAYTAQTFIAAISDKKSGVLEWIKARW
jgi:hypothetical protein